MTLLEQLPQHQRIALFLDIDGTLLEIGTRPHTSQVGPSLQRLLERATEKEQGALALVSGRTLVSIDTLFAPKRFSASGQHGLERRSASGALWHAPFDQQALETARTRMHEMRSQHPALWLEDKHISLAMHYRHTPELADWLVEQAQTLHAMLQPHIHLQMGKYAVELMPAGFSKRTAIEAFMTEAPFAGRIPVFLGDDVADEDGFAAVNALNGHSIRVGADNAPTEARHRLSSVGDVLDWLRTRYA